MNETQAIPNPKRDGEVMIEAIIVAAQLVNEAYVRQREKEGIPQALDDCLVILRGVIAAAELTAEIPRREPCPMTAPRQRCNGGVH